MLIPSRILPVARRLFYRNKDLVKSYQTIRNASDEADAWTYRSYYTKENFTMKQGRIAGYALSTFMWYWVLFHLWYDWDMIWPTHPVPDPSKWTDAELGIPPDDEDD